MTAAEIKKLLLSKHGHDKEICNLIELLLPCLEALEKIRNNACNFPERLSLGVLAHQTLKDLEQKLKGEG